MSTHKQLLATACGLALFVAAAPARAAQSQPSQQSQAEQSQPSPSANFVGTWFLNMEGGGRGAGRRGGPNSNGNGNGNGGDNGSANAPSGNNGAGDNAPPANDAGGNGDEQVRQAFVITADGSNFQVSHRTRQGETVSQATASGNTLTWTEQRTGREGRTVEAKFTATLTGDSMQGTVAGPRGRVQRQFTGTRQHGQ
jgi:hypothetical protein